MTKIDNESDATNSKDTVIRINDAYVLCMDAYNLWVVKETKAKNEKTGKEYIAKTRVAGYCRNYEDLLESFIERKEKTAKAKDAEAHIVKCEKIERETKAFARALARTLDEKYPRGKKGDRK